MEVLIDIRVVNDEEWERKFSQHILCYSLGIRLEKEVQDTGRVSQTKNVNEVIISESGRTTIADFLCLPRMRI
jgi:hypothetical protein